MYEELQERLEDVLSSYNGADIENALMSHFTQDELLMLAGYSGADEGNTPLLQFDGTFNAQRDANRVYTLTVTGHATNNEVLYINPDWSISETANGHPISGKGTGGNALTINGSPTSVASFYRYLQNVPMNAMGLRLVSSDVTQLNSTITVTQFEDGPFNQGKSYSIFPSSFGNERDNRTDMVTINQPLMFGRNQRIEIPILATKTIQITMFFGARMDNAATAAALVRKNLAANPIAKPNIVVIPAQQQKPPIRNAFTPNLPVPSRSQPQRSLAQALAEKNRKFGR